MPLYIKMNKFLKSKIISDFVEYLEFSYIAGGNVKLYSHSGKLSVSSKVNAGLLLYDPAMPLLGIHLREMFYVHTKTSTQVFITTLSTIARI